MKVRYTGEYYKVSLGNEAIYDVISVEDGYYRIKSPYLDYSYLYRPEDFAVVEGEPPAPVLVKK